MELVVHRGFFYIPLQIIEKGSTIMWFPNHNISDSNFACELECGANTIPLVCEANALPTELPIPDMVTLDFTVGDIER